MEMSRSIEGQASVSCSGPSRCFWTFLPCYSPVFIFSILFQKYCPDLNCVFCDMIVKHDWLRYIFNVSFKNLEAHSGDVFFFLQDEKYPWCFPSFPCCPDPDHVLHLQWKHQILMLMSGCSIVFWTALEMWWKHVSSSVKTCRKFHS